ncbi:hypothetical protein [Elioraea sp.]|uniref:hypothetical protein n=1 Tax=Elioraea sp. TaxID=2185103 RepID=UPI0021DF31C9|nr:hypothetical protein [Elioraea sp.]GIX12029.1 MAG: hypothetical protein KatS3mg116_3739 [Elioraea sp.]
MSRPLFTDCGLRPMRPEMLERLTPIVDAVVRGTWQGLVALTERLPEAERAVVLRSVVLSLFVQHAARAQPAIRAHLLAQLPRLIEAEAALIERGGRSVS